MMDRISGPLRISEDRDGSTGNVHLRALDRSPGFCRDLHGLPNVLHVDVNEPERVHAGHLGRCVEHAAVHGAFLSEHVVHLAAAHVHFTGLRPAEERVVEPGGRDVIGRHEFVPGKPADDGLAIPGDGPVDGLVDPEHGALRILHDGEPSRAGNVFRPRRDRRA